MTSSTALPEIRESEAAADIAALYDDIRHATALPQVNLIFRHLATRPGVLPWVWQMLRPLYLSQELADAAHALSHSVPEAHAPSPIPALLPAAERDACRRVLEAYNSGNPQNLIALTAFVHALDGAVTRTTASGRITPRALNDGARDQPDFPPIPARNAISPEITDRLQRLAARHRTVPGVIPSLYVHLALRPDILAPLDAFLGEHLSAATWPGHVDAVIASATATAHRLAPHLAETSSTALGDDDRREMAETIRTFVNATIPEMVVVGRWLAWREDTI